MTTTLPVCDLEAKAIHADWASRGSGPANLLEADDLQALWEAAGGSADGSGQLTVKLLFVSYPLFNYI